MNATPVSLPRAAAWLRPGPFFGGPLSFADALVPLGIAAMVSVWMVHAYQPFLVHAIVQSLPPDAAVRFAADSGVSMARTTWISELSAVFQPVVKSGFYALMALLVLGALGYSPRFEALQVCAAWSMLVMTGKSVIQFFILSDAGLEAIRGPADLNIGTGLGFLAGSKESLAFEALELVNGFDLAFIYLFAAAIRLAGKTTSGHAVAAAALPWLLLGAIRLGFSAILYR